MHFSCFLEKKKTIIVILNFNVLCIFHVFYKKKTMNQTCYLCFLYSFSFLEQKTIFKKQVVSIFGCSF